MELQSACGWFHSHSPTLRLRLYPAPCQFSHHSMSSSFSLRNNASEPHFLSRQLTARFQNVFKSILGPDLVSGKKESLLPSLRREGVLCAASGHNQTAKLSFSEQKTANVHENGVAGLEPFRGKSGSISFYGLTHQSVEESKLVSAPFKEGTSSFLWLLAPIALISSLLLPQFLLGFASETILKDEILSAILASFSSELVFYIGLATFLLVTDRVQKPYLQFSPKRWSLVTGLRGYLTSVFFTMGFKVILPLLALFVTWPVLGLPAVVSVVPFLTGCLAQFAFEKYLDKCGSSCWPLVPIIFEVYRLYQLSKAAHFIETFLYAMKDIPITPEVLERGGALGAMVVTFQVLGVICLWSLITFLQRLFPSRPVCENY